MTPTLTKISELMANATPGPWARTFGFVMRQESETCVCSLVNCDGPTGANQDFIIAMRNNIAALIAVAKRAAEIAEALKFHGDEDHIGELGVELIESLVFDLKGLDESVPLNTKAQP